MEKKDGKNTEAPVGNIYLLGFMCSGKTLAGRALAGLIRRPFADSDAAVRRMTGHSPAALIRRRGLSRFRVAEEKAVRDIARKPGQVVALGGGFYPSGKRAALLRRTGTTVFLRCPWPELAGRLKASRGRPLLDGDRDEALLRAGKLHAARLPFYRRADITVSSGGLTPRQTAVRIKKALK